MVEQRRLSGNIPSLQRTSHRLHITLPHHRSLWLRLRMLGLVGLMLIPTLVPFPFQEVTTVPQSLFLPVVAAQQNTLTSQPPSGETLTFQDTEVDARSEDISISLTNTSTLTVNITRILVSGPNAAEFDVTPKTGFQIGPNQPPQTVTVAFTPRGEGTRSATFTIHNSVTAPVAFRLTGNGLRPGTGGTDQKRLVAAHYLRRMGFGASPADLEAVIRIGPSAYVTQQLNPQLINDSAAESKLPPFSYDAEDPFDQTRRRWVARMTYSQRQLQEKMTLFWHEFFSVSVHKVPGRYMVEHEALLRKNCLGNFKTILTEMSKNNAMLIWLDNNYNDGNAYDDEGNLIPPNQNFARELMQLYSIGPIKLRTDGTPITDGSGVPVPSYTENDVREMARAVTGWIAGDENEDNIPPSASRFEPGNHDQNNKQLFGTTLVGRKGADGVREIEDVVTLLMRQPSLPPFIAKQLIQKFASETPSPAYVSRVAAAFTRTGGNIKETMRALLLDAEFASTANIRSQYKEPTEHVIGVVRALNGTTDGRKPMWVMEGCGLDLLAPPSVFSFYRPGQKISLLDTALIFNRDNGVAWILDNDFGTTFDYARIIQLNQLTTPTKVVDYLSNVMIGTKMDSTLRTMVINSMENTVTVDKFVGAAWLISCSADYQRN